MSTLDPDARLFLERLAAAMPRPISELGVQAGRDLRMAGELPSGPELFWVEELRLPNSSSGAKVRVYRPSNDDDLPVLVYLHGGGWSIGSLDGVDAVCRALAASARCVVVSVDYRQAPEHPFPAPLDDSWAALAWVAAGGLRHVDHRTVAIAGDSAGGNLALACAVLAREEWPTLLCAQLLVYPATDALDDSASMRTNANAPVLTAADVAWFWDMYVPDVDLRSHPSVSPKKAATLEGLPPTLVVTAELDPLRDDGEDLVRRLSESGVEVEHRRVDRIFHGFFPMVGVLRAADESVEWAASGLARAFDRHREKDVVPG